MECPRCHVDSCDGCRISYQVLPEHSHVQPKPMAVGNLYGREDAIQVLRCIACQADVPQAFAERDPEYVQSGLCQLCQSSVFGCTCDSPCCQADIGVGVINCGSQHCPEHGWYG